MKNKGQDVLVLNKVYVAINIVKWRKALSLIVQDAARPMDNDCIPHDLNSWFEYSQKTNSHAVINTVSRKIAIPEIIILKEYDRLPQREIKYSRHTLFQRDNFKCGYCGDKFAIEELTVDHILPRCQGGKTTWLNTTTACFDCNSEKADRTPEQAGMKLLRKPKKPMWVSPFNSVTRETILDSWEKFAMISISE